MRLWTCCFPLTLIEISSIAGSLSAAQNAAAMAQMYNHSLPFMNPFFPSPLPYPGLGDVSAFPSPLSPSSGKIMLSGRFELV